jgi:CHASE3 domain sensor protein
MRWSIGRKIASAFGLVVTLLLVVGAVSRDSAAKLIDSSEWVQHTHQVLTGPYIRSKIGAWQSMPRESSHGS